MRVLTGRQRRLVMLAALAGAAAPAALSAERVPLALSHWRIEAEDRNAKVSQHGPLIDIDSAKGLTLWFDRPLTAPVTIRFEARAVSGSGPNDKVSDLNAFWMATENDGGSPLDHPRNGAFEAYDTLRTYYVGIGGNRNSTTRMRRYVGRPGDRPLLPEHDRQDKAAMLVPDRWTAITLIADGARIAVERDGQPLFSLTDAAPYRHGWFGLRTTWSHIQVRRVTLSPR
ncbi:Tat pathway signal sequence domain protein [Sphingomonas sp. AP4-R1]|uniref:DUF6250 domain-containing protein n=1 Tax=Sphingomonas sp. AP4-R1 TaxID=2735134 RepID=UPI001493B123|nr:DUF6250 domain-containing protein [Sphingomonas sp. AP4-R1]QJU59860.1 Tat pathway signal sequence domain protein [Sphingomonas sp. AP4-R1]